MWWEILEQTFCRVPWSSHLACAALSNHWWPTNIPPSTWFHCQHGATSHMVLLPTWPCLTWNSFYMLSPPTQFCITRRLCHTVVLYPTWCYTQHDIRTNKAAELQGTWLEQVSQAVELEFSFTPVRRQNRGRRQVVYIGEQGRTIHSPIQASLPRIPGRRVRRGESLGRGQML